MTEGEKFNINKFAILITFHCIIKELVIPRLEMCNSKYRSNQLETEFFWNRSIDTVTNRMFNAENMKYG